jgi:hypothetical protein
MNAKISIILILVSVIMLNAFTLAQITFTAADAKALSVVGNVARNYSNASISSANIGFPGGGNNWNFGGIVATDSSTETIVAPSSTPYFSDFPTSNIVSFSSTFQDPYTTIVYLYELAKQDRLILLGQEGTSNSDTSTLWSKLVDDSAVVIVPLPFTYNTRWGNKFITHSTTIHDGVNNGTTNFPIVDSEFVDAYGKITMPDGTFLDALRVKKVFTVLRPNGTYKTTTNYNFYTTGGYSFSIVPTDSMPPNSGTIPVSALSWGITKVKGAISISKPSAGEVVLANQPYNITWSAAGITSPVRISYSTDAGNSFTTIANSVAANANNFAWDVPDALSAKCVIDIVDIADTTIKGVAGYFKIKGYVLTRINNSGDYEKFEPPKNGWQFLNDQNPMWLSSWWTQFNYKTGIDPYTNKFYPADFSKTYSSNFPDWPLWVSIFTPAQCYIGSGGAYNAKTLLKWQVFSDSTFMGSCFGFSISSYLAFDYTNQFVVANPGIPAFTNLFDLSMNEAIRSVINGDYLLQAGKQTQDYRVTAGLKDPRTTLQEIKDMLFSENPNIQAVGIYNNNGLGGGAHSLAPYKLLKDPVFPDTYDLFVYDSNNPGDTTRYIEIDSLNDKWSDQTGLGPTWQGNSHFYLGLPVANYLTTPILGKSKPVTIEKIDSTGNIEFYNSPNANVMYTSSTGKRIGLIDSTVTNEIKNGIPIFKITGHRSNPIGFYIPDDAYSMVLTNPHNYSGNVYLKAFKNNVIYNYERDSAKSTQTDRFKIDNGFSVTSPDAVNKLINLEVIAESDTNERIMFVNNTSLAQNDSLFTQQVNQSNFIMKNFGKAKTYDLELNDRSVRGQKVFQYFSVPLKANTTHTLVPEWSNLNLSNLKILIDTGNKGTNDDSLILVNQYTGVNDHNQPNTPNSYRLAQNYPNPFNPTTTINYQLQFSGRVTLKVYNILGKEVAALVNEEKPAGNYSVNFDAGKLSSGIYFYRLQSGNFIETKKMILLK